MPGHIDNMIELLGPREVIGQAINLLMSRDDMSRDAAFDMSRFGPRAGEQPQ